MIKFDFHQQEVIILSKFRKKFDLQNQDIVLIYEFKIKIKLRSTKIFNLIMQKD